MVFADLFSTSFLFSTAIIIILIGGIFAYVNYRMVEQDNKLSSMVSLVSILAQDLQFVKSKLHANATANTNANANTNEIDETNNLQYASQIMGGSDLISVSDDEEEKEDEEQDGDEEQDDEDEETYSDDESYEEEEEVDDSTNHIKLLNLTLANENFEDEHYIEDLSSPEREDDIKIIHIENNLAEESEEPTTHIEVPPPPPTESKISMDDMNFLKSVTITDLGEIEDVSSSKTDYKKMSINKLREIVVSKGLVTDASKLKKPEILNLLGDE